MEALWRIEDRLKLSTQAAILLFICVASLVIGLCTTTAMKKMSRRKQLVGDQEEPTELRPSKWPKPATSGWGKVNRALESSVRWSGASKWEDDRNIGRSWKDQEQEEGDQIGLQRPSPLPLLGGRGPRDAAEVGWQSRNSASWNSPKSVAPPVWQRPILMGEKCELPRFSGLILYDERGRPLNHHHANRRDTKQEVKSAAVRTTLRDLL